MSSTTRGKNWFAGCWSTNSFVTRPACSKSGAASGASGFHGWPTICRGGMCRSISSRSRKSSCGIWWAQFGRVLKAKHAVAGPESIRYDETPIHVHMQWIDERLRRDGRVAFTQFFEGAVHKSKLVGMFLAVLELVRHQHAHADQPELFGEIWLEPGEKPLPAELAVVADYDHKQADER